MIFSEFGLKNGILRALDEVGYTHPTPIQEQVIRLAMAGNNVVAQSQTGTGKTAAFVLPILHQIDTNTPGLQALIIAPTRELVQQITDEIYKFTKYYRVRAAAIYGGASMVKQTTELKKSPTIIVATPGRLMDFMEQKLIDVSKVQYFVLDEVDRMLDMGFVRDITGIRKKMSHIKQTITMSATMTDAVKKIINDHVTTYESVKIGSEITVEKINHSYIDVLHDDKFITMLGLLDTHAGEKIIIFTHTKRNTKTIYTVLTEQGYRVGLLNGDLKQSRRMSMLKAFKENAITILVTTDVAARGLNMENVGLVINFDVPQDAENYIHRIGRTGRAGAEGKAIMLVSPDEARLVTQIEKVNKITLKQSPTVSVNDSAGKYRNVKLSTPKIKGAKQPPRGVRTTSDSGSTASKGGNEPRSVSTGGARRRSAGRSLREESSHSKKRSGRSVQETRSRTEEYTPSHRASSPKNASRPPSGLRFGSEGKRRESNTNGDKRVGSQGDRRRGYGVKKPTAARTADGRDEATSRTTRFGDRTQKKSHAGSSTSSRSSYKSADSGKRSPKPGSRAGSGSSYSSRGPKRPGGNQKRGGKR